MTIARTASKSASCSISTSERLKTTAAGTHFRWSSFRLRGPTVPPDAPQPIHVGHFPASGERVRLTDTVDRTTGRICFAALARDSTRLPSSGGQEHCVTTVEPPFFNGCSVGSGDPKWSFALLLIAALLRSKRRRGCLTLES